jgi:hypothetical protein
VVRKHESYAVSENKKNHFRYEKRSSFYGWIGSGLNTSGSSFFRGLGIYSVPK